MTTSGAFPDPGIPATDAEDRRIARQVAALVAALTVVKLVLARQAEITANEAYHWLFATHPDLGYFNHPGMIGWVLWLSMRIFGDGPVGVRALTILCGSGTIILVFMAARKLYGPREARWAAFLAALVPELFQLSSVAFPDAPLLLFWSATLLALAHALTDGSWFAWLGTGLGLGLAMESKYLAVFLGVGILLYLASSPEHRSWLRHPAPYAAVLLAGILFTPAILWNARNDWVSFRYQGISRFNETGGSVSNMFRWFPLTELTHLTPVVCLWVWGCGLHTLLRWNRSSWQDRLLTSLGMPLLLFLSVLSFRRRIHGHWSAAAYPSLLVLLGSTLPRARSWVRRLHGVMLALLLAGYLLLPGILAALPGPWIARWSQVAREVRRRSPEFVVAPNYHAAAQLAYHLRPMATTDLSVAGLGHPFFSQHWAPDGFAGKDALIVLTETDSPEILEKIRSRFQSLDSAESIPIVRFGGKEELFLLIRARAYRGLNR